MPGQNGLTCTAFTRAIIFSCAVLAAACSSSSGTKENGQGNAVQQAIANCIAGDFPLEGGDAIQLQQVFANLSFNQLINIYQPPGDNSRWYAIQKGGAVLTFPNVDDTPSGSLVQVANLDVDNSGEGGLLGLAFHPDFGPANRQVFLSYTANVGGNMVSRVARYTLDMAGTSFTGTPDILISLQQPATNHNGGNIMFGADGYLYIGLGDGGGGIDLVNKVQSRNRLLGTMLRIDVDNTAGGANYAIPVDNPFYNATPSCPAGECPTTCAVTPCPEVYAWGFRNPWRWSFDRGAIPERLWLGDVGQNSWEEIDIVTSGNNYGWPCYEGNDTYYTTGLCAALVGAVFPVAEYPHDGPRSITGGFVYRGSSIPALAGSYVYTDYETGLISALVDPYGTPVSHDLLSSGLPIVSFAQDQGSELYTISIFGNAIHKIVPGSGSLASAVQQLSDTGCIDNNNPPDAPASLIPYDINSPLWSDGAEKFRWISLPEGAQIHIENDLDWTFPVGSVLRKDFHLGGELIETRLLARHSNGNWMGYGYKWNAAGTDATLVANGEPAAIGMDQWYFPGLQDCMQCHTDPAGRTLGPETAQMNRDFTDPRTGMTGNQLQVYADAALFDAPLPDVPANLPALANPADVVASDEARARSYLHANCSFCHREGGGGRGSANFLYDLAFADMQVCNAPALDDLGNVNNRLLVPQTPGLSVISLRMHDEGASRMPPLASFDADPTGTSVIDAWISGIMSCPP